MSHNAWNYNVKNALMYNPTGVQFTKEELSYRQKSRPIIDPKATRLDSEIDPFTKAKMDKIKAEKLTQLHKQGKLGIDGNLPSLDQSSSNLSRFFNFKHQNSTLTDFSTLTLKDLPTLTGSTNSSTTPNPKQKVFAPPPL